MVKIALQIKAQLENITDLQPDGEDFRWYLKFKCSNCNEESDHFQYISLIETAPLKGGRGTANMVSKCKLCSRENSVSILQESIKKYTVEDSGSFKTIVAFEGRGMEPVDYSPRMGFSAVGVDSPAKFSVDLQEGDWADYDEHKSQSVGIFELEHKFVRL